MTEWKAGDGNFRVRFEFLCFLPLDEAYNPLGGTLERIVLQRENGLARSNVRAPWYNAVSWAGEYLSIRARPTIFIKPAFYTSGAWAARKKGVGGRKGSG